MITIKLGWSGIGAMGRQTRVLSNDYWLMTITIFVITFLTTFLCISTQVHVDRFPIQFQSANLQELSANVAILCANVTMLVQWRQYWNNQNWLATLCLPTTLQTKVVAERHTGKSGRSLSEKYRRWFHGLYLKLAEFVKFTRRYFANYRAFRPKKVCRSLRYIEVRIPILIAFIAYSLLFLWCGEGGGCFAWFWLLGALKAISISRSFLFHSICFQVRS